jgi:hypothetical protein
MNERSISHDVQDFTIDDHTPLTLEER